jgi:hypothetical protein
MSVRADASRSLKLTSVAVQPRRRCCCLAAAHSLVHLLDAVDAVALAHARHAVDDALETAEAALLQPVVDPEGRAGRRQVRMLLGDANSRLVAKRASAPVWRRPLRPQSAKLEPPNI